MNLKTISNYKITPNYHKKLKDMVTPKPLKEIKKAYEYLSSKKVNKTHYLDIYV